MINVPIPRLKQSPVGGWLLWLDVDVEYITTINNIYSITYHNYMAEKYKRKPI
jgi:hypothetical protein